MTRREFTKNLVLLIIHAHELGYEPYIDWVMRSAAEQNHLYYQGKSKCDGYKIKSNHQFGLAADLKLWESAKSRVIGHEGKEKYQKLHDYWVTLGGKPMMEWDICHFEV